MTASRTPLSRTELAGLLTDTARSVSGILTAEYPTPAGRSYLHPVLGPLAAGPRVIGELNDRLEEFFGEPLPATPAGLFTLASYASALGWLTESLAELTTSVDQICTRAGLPTTPQPDPDSVPPGDAEPTEPGFRFSALELAAIRTAAEAAGLTPGGYVDVLSQSLLADSRITDACTEISSGLREDAKYVLDEVTNRVRLGDGPGSLPTLVRSLLARMEAAE
ncbi:MULTISPECIES: hypothetical protein [unclassified Streptomyces]|uniref:hypothetical protein n=1 Tax=unclassified Streptomyces TaxID=2593676 RepID=UPI00081F73E0|nr:MULTISPECIES: hypothetical protein [unclassified Streptomyces]MYZ35736.1 hypothetical protein [Streptomyces sp. SID4917]SCF77978.1 hypothetical protein GA0115259_1024416 [Streptomyces sp. MnatMP-M17]